MDSVKEAKHLDILRSPYIFIALNNPKHFSCAVQFKGGYEWFGLEYCHTCWMTTVLN